MYHSWAHSHGVLTSPRELPKFWQDQNDPNGYADYVPSAHTLQKFHLEWLERRDEFETAVQQSVGGTILAADMSHKITKLIFVNGNVKAFYGLLTVMNEHGQVVGWWLAKTGAHNELREAMQSLDQRYRLHSFVLPALFYTDKTIADKHFLTDVFPSLQDDDVHPGPAAEQELVAGHPIHAMLVPFPIVCFTLALIADIAYWRTSNLMWLEFSAWLLLAGIVFGVLAAVFGAIDFFARPEIRSLKPAWPHAIGNLIALILAFFNNLVHTADGWTAVVPWGLTLSALTVLVMLVTGWLGAALVHIHGVGVRYYD